MSGCNEGGQFGLTVVINYTHNPANERKVDFPTVNRRWGMMQDSFQPRIAQNRVPVIVKAVAPISVPLALKICAVPEPLKEFRVALSVTSEIPTINAESFPVESKTKFFILNL